VANQKQTLKSLLRTVIDISPSSFSQGQEMEILGSNLSAAKALEHLSDFHPSFTVF
jgi:hypothetical protein